MENLPQLTLVADTEGASKRKGISLVRKILSEKQYTGNEIFMVVRRIWFTKENPMVEEIGQNTFLFTFKTEMDRNRVWHRRPWTINKAHLILREWKLDIALEEIDFNSTTFWIQSKALPLQFMTKKNVELIGNLFKKLLRYESSTRTNIIGTKYLRLQVEIDVNKPISGGFFHNMGKGGKWMAFQYERLPDLCYRCGILRHMQKKCTVTEAENHKIMGDIYGPWLKEEMEAANLHRERESLRRVEIKKMDILTIFLVISTQIISMKRRRIGFIPTRRRPKSERKGQGQKRKWKMQTPKVLQKSRICRIKIPKKIRRVQ